MAKRPSEIVQVRFRMRADLHRRLQREAEKRGLTLNADVLRRIEASLKAEEAASEVASIVTQTAEATANAVTAALGFEMSKYRRIRNALDWNERSPEAMQQAEQAAIEYFQSTHRLDAEEARKRTAEVVEHMGKLNEEDTRAHGLSMLMRWIERKQVQTVLDRAFEEYDAYGVGPLTAHEPAEPQVRKAGSK